MARKIDFIEWLQPVEMCPVCNIEFMTDTSAFEHELETGHKTERMLC